MFDVKPITSPVNADCGPTCLQMLLDYYGEETSLKDLTRECGVGIAGCTARNVMQCGRAHGLDMRAYRTDVDGVVLADRPSIVWWKYGHFCVCCGIDDDGNIVICNPDRGRYRMSKSLFKALYSGIALFNGVPEDIEGQEIIDVYEHVFMR